MTISITQCVLIGLWTAFCLAGMLFGIYTNRCLIMSAGVGLILGDLPTGLAMGAVGCIYGIRRISGRICSAKPNGSWYCGNHYGNHYEGFRH